MVAPTRLSGRSPIARRSCAAASSALGIESAPPHRALVHDNFQTIAAFQQTTGLALGSSGRWSVSCNRIGRLNCLHGQRRRPPMARRRTAIGFRQMHGYRHSTRLQTMLVPFRRNTAPPSAHARSSPSCSSTASPSVGPSPTVPAACSMKKVPRPFHHTRRLAYAISVIPRPVGGAPLGRVG